MNRQVRDRMSLGNAASTTDLNYSLLKDSHSSCVRRSRGPFRETPSLSLWIRGNSVLLAYTRNTLLVDKEQLDS